MEKLYEKKYGYKKLNYIVICNSIVTVFYDKISEPKVYLYSVSDLQSFYGGKEYCKNHE